MVRLATVCPDCDKFVGKKIQIDSQGEPIWVCPECGTVHQDRTWYKEVKDKATYERIGSIKGVAAMYLFDTGIEVIGIVTDGVDKWKEEFPDRTECLTWLASHTV